MLLGVSCPLLAAARRCSRAGPSGAAHRFDPVRPAGLRVGWWRAELRLAEALPMSEEGRDVSVLGVIDGLPAKTVSGVRFPFLVESGPSWLPGRVSLAWYFPRRAGLPVPNLQPGNAGRSWFASSVLMMGQPWRERPHLADARRRDKNESGYVREAPTNRRIDAAATGLSQMVTRLRGQIRARMLRKRTTGSGRACWWRWRWVTSRRSAMNSGPVPPPWHRASGVISGLHVTLIGALAWSLAEACGVAADAASICRPSTSPRLSAR